VCEITGHKSEAVRDYKRTNESMKRTCSSILNGSGTETCAGVAPPQKRAAEATVTTATTASGVSGPGFNITLNVTVNK